MIIDRDFFDGYELYDSGAGRWLTANGSATATSNGYSAVNVRIKFCQHEHGGQFMRKRYLPAPTKARAVPPPGRSRLAAVMPAAWAGS